MSPGVRSASPDGGAVVARAVELQLERRRRKHSLRWSALHAALLLVLAYDLSCKCAGYTSLLHYVELGAAGALCAGLLRRAARLLPARRAALPATRQQLRLMALSPDDLDSSFRVVEPARPSAAPSPSPSPPPEDAEQLSLSLSPARKWRVRTPPPSPPGSHSPPGSPCSPAGSPGSVHDSSFKDEFIADTNTLNDYLKQYASRARHEGGWDGAAGPGAGAGAGPGGAGRVPLSPPPYMLAALDNETLPADERAGGGGPDGPAGGPGGLAAHVRVWWRLRLDPLRLTQFNLNLRLWLQMTILERLVRALDAADAALERLGLAHTLGQVSAARLRALAAGAAPALGALLPYLEPFADQHYLVTRLRELARGGCLSEYRWNGGGRGWEAGRPCDAELLLHLFAAYMDGQLPGRAGGAGDRPFSAAHVCVAPPAAPPRALAVQRVSQRPPHYVLLLRGETLDVGRGRNNLLHTLLLFVAAAARDPPPSALRRLQLGPAGLNILWVIGR